MKTPKKQPVEIQPYQFSSLPSLNDRILVFTRSHIFYFWVNIMSSIILLSLVFFALSWLFIFFDKSLLILLITPVLTIAIGLTIVVNEFLSWYFHFYLVTKRKIVEVCNTPFGKYFINEIMLDRVKCTEVDISSNGIINQLLRIGDVIVTFDRPTQHRDSFIFNNVSNSNSIREILTDYFSEGSKEASTWYMIDRQKSGLIYPISEISSAKLHA